MSSTDNKPHTQAISEQAISMDNIPILDYQHPDFPIHLVSAFKNIGFAILTNHSISKELIDENFSCARKVFSLPTYLKRKSKISYEENRGYTGPGEEILNGDQVNDEKKQTFDVGHPDGENERQYYPDDEEFINCTGKLYRELGNLHYELLGFVEKGLGIPQGTMKDNCDRNGDHNTLRHLYYPEVDYETLKQMGKTRCGAHTDYSLISLLIQRPGFGQDGLRAMNLEKKWVKVEAPDYAIILNLGDLCQRWANDKLISTIHQVEVDDKIIKMLENGQIAMAPARQSIGMFFVPDQGKILKCLPGTGEPKYQPFDGKQYVINRRKVAYGKK